MGFPMNMFTVLFALGRLPGWIAQYREQVASGGNKIWRPRQIFTGSDKRDYVHSTSVPDVNRLGGNSTSQAGVSKDSYVSLALAYAPYRYPIPLTIFCRLRAPRIIRVSRPPSLGIFCSPDFGLLRASPRCDADRLRHMDSAEAMNLPKVVLHDHLDGGLRPATVLELAAQRGRPVPAQTPEDLATWFF
ncbi:adenosine deaminase [Cutibacterium acnes JCM 18918]|nr:adenosine deaminase [Cutibacterium acnes JCM 18918]